MENLLLSYQCIYEKPILWDYYDRYKKDEFDLFSHDFIEKYFKDGGKKNVVDEIFELSKSRRKHTTSTFFIGIRLKELLHFDSLNKLKPDFRYLWFLTCLFHDYGYIIESNKEKYPTEIYTIEALRLQLNIPNKNFLLSKWIPKFIPLIYEKDTVLRYFEFCRQKMSKPFINHGYVSSILLYDRLIKNFEQKRKGFKKSEKINSTPKYFIYENLEWSVSDKVFYREAAESILAHNIWFCTEEKDRKSYEDYKLDNLIIIKCPEKRISFEKSPLLFLLALADTIEPLKAFPDIKPECLLKKIKIDKIENGFQIEILDECLDPNNWFDNICKMQEWLKISVRKVYGCKDTLHLTLDTENNEGKNNIDC